MSHTKQQVAALQQFVALLGRYGADRDIGERIIKNIQESAPHRDRVCYGHGRVDDNPFGLTAPLTNYEQFVATHELADAATAYYKTLERNSDGTWGCLLLLFVLGLMVVGIICLCVNPLLTILAGILIAVIWIGVKVGNK